MNIIYCIPSLHNSGGMERVLTQKANYLADKSGFDVTIITTSQKERKPFYQLSSKVKLHDIDIDYESISNMPIHKRIIQRIKAKRLHKKRLKSFLLKEKSDITVSMFTHEMSFLPDIEDGSKKILELHFSKNFRKLDAKSNGRSSLIRFINHILDSLDRKAIHRYSKFVVLSHRDANDWGNDYKNLAVIPNPTVFKPEKRNPCDNKRALAVGRLCPQKGFDLLIDVWNMLPSEIKEEWHLDIIGNGPDKDSLLAKIKKYGLLSSISLIPHTDRIQEEYKNHSIFCFPSRYEGFPLALMEAMSFSLPSVAFDCPCGPSELIENAKNGFLIAPEDINTFAEKLKKLIYDKGLRHDMAHNASNFIESNFSEEVIMSKWIDLFNSLSTQ